MDKKQVRKELLSLRNRLSLKDIEDKSQQIINKIKELEVFQMADQVYSYLSFGSEVNLSGLHVFLWESGKDIYVPKILNPKEMDFYLFRPDTPLQENKYGILEPEGDPVEGILKNSLIIVPGLAYNMEKYRLGYGGGYYDRYLARYNHNHPGITLGVFFDQQLSDQLFLEDHDQSLDWIVTEKTILT